MRKKEQRYYVRLSNGKWLQSWYTGRGAEPKTIFYKPGASTFTRRTAEKYKERGRELGYTMEIISA